MVALSPPGDWRADELPAVTALERLVLFVARGVQPVLWLEAA